MPPAPAPRTPATLPFAACAAVGVALLSPLAAVAATAAVDGEGRWWLNLTFGLMGGLALFLYGMRLMSEGLRNVLGERMRALLGTLTRSRLLAVAVGAAITMVVQSSSATTVMLVGFVQAGLMTFAQTVGVILGAHIGTTITAQIIAFRLTDMALPIVALGFATLLLGRGDRWRHTGQGVLGFGLLFFGMKIMADALRPLSGQQAFVSLILAPDWPLLGVLVGALLTAAIQSSSAFTGVLIVLASQGLLSLSAAIPLILGSNIGTSITAALASLHTRREAKRVALAHALVHGGGVLAFVWLVEPFAEVVRWVSPAAGENPIAATARQIANAHTLFNLAVVLCVLPLMPALTRWVEWLLPERPQEALGPYRTRYLDDAGLDTPALALKLARAEVVRLGQLVKQMVERAVEPFLERRTEPLLELERMEEEVDFLEAHINGYLTRIGQRQATATDVEEAFQLMYAATELEQIADIVTKAICPRAGNWLVSGRRFSPHGEAELRAMHLSAIKQIARAITLLRERSAEQAARMRDKYHQYRAQQIAFMRSHFERLRHAVPESLASAELHEELMEQLVRIASHATNIARVVLDNEAAPPDDTAQPTEPVVVAPPSEGSAP